MPTQVMHSYSFTPTTSGTAKSIFTCSAAWNGSDFGAGSSLHIRVTQGASVVNLDPYPLPSSRQSMAIVGSAPVAVGSAVTVAVVGTLSGAAAMSAWDMQIHTEIFP